MTGRSWVRLAVGAAVLWLGWLLRSITVPLLASYLLCLLLVPLKTRLQPRLGATGAIIVCLSLLLVVPLVLALPTALEFDDFVALLPTQERAEGWAQELQARLDELRAELPEEVAGLLDFREDRVREWSAALGKRLTGLGSSLAAFLGGFFGILSTLLLLPVFTFFLLQGAPWEPRARAELPPEWRASYDRVVPRILEIMRRYARARVLVALFKGLVWFALLLIGGVPGAYTLALLAGVLSLLPVFGPLLAFAGLALVSFADPTSGVGGLVYCVVAYGVAEAFEGYVLMPRLVGRGLGLGDFAVILAVMAGGVLGGIFGMLVAIPLVAIGLVLYDEFLRPVMGTAEA